MEGIDRRKVTTIYWVAIGQLFPLTANDRGDEATGLGRDRSGGDGFLSGRRIKARTLQARIGLLSGDFTCRNHRSHPCHRTMALTRAHARMT